ncbi:hypothetical protein [Microbacterium pumilum]|uniref:Secreted protein n=1 Tax=Microbacterium pumilum TaxID=344165 RepID=A0ABP5E3M1_9MICO
MDVIAWLVIIAVLTVALIAVGLAPRLKRDNLRRQLEGGGGSFAAVGIGFDAVWRPSAEDARATWEAQVELPAPAPTPGDKGRLEEGRIVIEVDPRD